MNYIEAPNEVEKDAPGPILFLGGGISGCPDWQAVLTHELRELTGTLLNPRRINFPMHDPTAAKAQITWEYQMLRRADAISFWFPKETLCPIVLYELGAWSMTSKPIFVGVEPGYQRAQDVEIQTGLIRPEILIAQNLTALASHIRVWAKGR